MLAQRLLKPNLLKTVSKSQIRLASTAISQASISGLDKRWENLPEPEKKTVIDALSERQKLPWDQLTAQEKKAAYYISFGDWGPRRPLYNAAEKRTIFWGTVAGLGICTAVFLGIRHFRNVPKTMHKDWQEKSDEYLKSKHANPFSHYSQVQSK